MKIIATVMLAGLISVGPGLWQSGTTPSLTVPVLQTSTPTSSLKVVPEKWRIKGEKEKKD